MSDTANRIWCFAMTCWLWGLGAVAGEAPLRVRMENFTVTPSTGPVVGVQVENLGKEEREVALRVRWPEGWRGAPEEQKVTVKAGDSATAAFTIEKAVDVAANRYPGRRKGSAQTL